ncbi:MAG: hypothetical protein PHP06_05425 [Clostridia bacterium]|nr:hypothetical protein [Clostridia bacterium]
MQCPRCKAINKGYHKYCFNCGLKLIKGEPELDNYEEKQKLEYLLNQVESADDELSSDIYSDAIDNALPLSRKERRRKNKKSYNKPKITQIVLASIGICITLVLISYLLKNIYLKPEPIWFDYSVEPTDNNTHTITIQTNQGNSILINNKTYTAHDGVVELELDDRQFIDQNETETEKIKVDIPLIISKKGVKDKNLNISYVIDIKLTALKILMPKDKDVYTPDDHIRVVLATQPNAKLEINQRDYSDLIDEEGHFETSIPITEKHNQLVVTASAPGLLENTKTLTVNKQKTDVKLSFDSDIPYKVSNNTVTISGTTDKDAEITTTSKIHGSISLNRNTGQFKLDILLENIGENIIEITARKGDNLTTTRQINIEREISEDEYTRKALAIKYGQLAAQAPSFKDKIVLYKGRVSEIINHQDNKLIFILDVGYDQGKNQPIYIEYDKKPDFKPGDIIRVFGNVDGYHDQEQKLPKIIAKYIYNF